MADNPITPEEKFKRDAIPPEQSITSYLSSFFRDLRVLQIIGQLIVIFFIVVLLALLVVRITTSFEERGITLNWAAFLTKSGFQITESPAWYDSQSSTYAEAFLVGILNTLRTVSVGLVGATIIGVLVGIFLLSTNWLIRTISRVYVEILRNTPLLMQLYFWYFIIFFNLPDFDAPLTAPAESISRIPVAYVAYFFLILIAWLFWRGSKYRNQVTIGALAGIVAFEVYRGLLGGSVLLSTGATPIVPWVGSILLVTILVLMMVNWFAPPKWRVMALAALIIVGGQVLVHFIFFMGYYLAVFESPLHIVAQFEPILILTRKGVAMPEILLTRNSAQWGAFLAAGFGLAIAIWVIGGHVIETTGRPIRRGWYALLALVAVAAIGWGFITSQPGDAVIDLQVDGETVETTASEALAEGLLDREQQLFHTNEPVLIALPQQGRFRFEQGNIITLEYGALLIGLIIYTSAFIAEIVRAGIQAVPYGQIEAARALGLSYPQTLQRVILPQALRVIIPPLGNQYLNLSKNSSLAAAVAFADTYQVGQTVMNQSGQTYIGFFIIFIVYLSLSLIISVFMNYVNGRFQLVTR